MMPKSGSLFGAIPAAQGQGTQTISASFPETPDASGEDFFSIVSQALAKNPDPSTVSTPSGGASYSSSVESDAVERSNDSSEEPQDTSSAPSKAKVRQSSSAASDKSDSMDASALSVIMSLMTQPDASPAEQLRLVSSRGKDFKVGPEPHDKEGAESNDSNREVSRQKAPGLLAEAASGAQATKPGQLVSKQDALSALKPDDEAGKNAAPKDSPARIESPPDPLVKPLLGTPQSTAIQDVAVAAEARMEPAVPIRGTRAALDNQRMKSAGEKNEIAGRTVQKLPNAPGSDDSSGGSTAKLDAKSNSDSSGQPKQSFDSDSSALLSASSIMTQEVHGKLIETGQAADTVAARIERVAHLVNQEVVMVRQSGANSLAVSLKVDANTELFLQLTNHNGQIQASLRCDRGNIEGLGSHWGELQESLARQNVQLMPLEGKTAIRPAPLVAPSSESASSRAFDQSSQNRRQQLRDPREEPPLAAVAVGTRSARKETTNNRPQKRWETWA